LGPSLLVTAKDDIVHISGKTGRFLEPAAGKAKRNLIAIAREGLNHALAEGFHRAMRDKLAVTLTNIPIDFNGWRLRLNVHVQPLEGGNPQQGLALVVLEVLALTDLLQPLP
jgi:two-component system CheB/CheR fusion protein